MPAAAKTKASKHSKTPYTRQSRPAKKDGTDADLLAKISDSSNLVENAAKRLYRLVSWVFTSGEDLSKTVGSSASKAIHREQPERSLTSQLEDGLLHRSKTDDDSLLAPDLVPHYLGKTPLAVKTRREPPSRTAAPAFRVPSFDSSQFKIPVLPSPPVDKSRQSKPSAPNEHASGKPPPRGRSLKSLEISAETQARHDEDILQWLSSQRLTPQDLVDGRAADHIEIDDRPKLNRVLQDSGFFRRQGLFPPIMPDANDEPTEKASQSRRLRRASSSHSFKSGSRARSPQSTQGRRLTSKDWQINSSTGILAAWRDICEQQENVAQSISLNAPRIDASRAASVDDSRRNSALWPEDISFSRNDNTESLRPVPELDVDLIEAGEKYWAPIRSYPMPDGDSSMHDRDYKVAISGHSNQGRNHRRRHSRQPSIARKSQARYTNEIGRNHSEVRPGTPTSVASSRQGRSRRPVNASREASRSRQRREQSVEPPRPQMVNSQVQTEDELMSFKPKELEYTPSAAPTVSKERRKRPGCFSALDEDLEEIFGPYTEQPIKKAKLNDDDDEIILRPRVPILREDDAVKRLRAQQQRERDEMPPPISDVPKSITNMPTGNFSKFTAESSVEKVAQPDTATFMFDPSQATQTTTPPAADSSKRATFKFGSSASNTQAENDTKAGSNQPASNGFNFPTPASQPPPASTAVPKFDFGHSPQKVAEAASDKDQVTTAPVFSFPSMSGKTPLSENGKIPAMSAESFSNAPKPSGSIAPFVFGSPDGTKKSSESGFKFGSTVESQPTKPSSFKFEAASKTTSGTETDVPLAIESSQGLAVPTSKASESTKFSFGQTNASSFKFGESKLSDESQPSKDLTKDRPATTLQASREGTAKPSTQFKFGAPAVPTQNGTSFNFPTTASSSGDTQGAEQPSSFKFGAATANPSGAPAFGGFGKASDTTTPTFAFGSNGATTSATQSGVAETQSSDKSKPVFEQKSGTPAFGSSDSAPAFNANATSTPAFTFGQPATTPSNSNIFGEQPSASATSGFGQTQTSSSDKPSIFTSAPAPASIATSNSFTFKANTAPSTNSTSGSLPFGSNAPSSANTSNNIPAFGAAAATSASTPSFGGFGQPSQSPFGTAQTTVPTNNAGTTTFGFGSNNANPTIKDASNTAPAQSSGFSFGQSTNPPAAQSNGFQFGAQQSAATPSFQFGQSPAPNTTQTPSFQFNAGAQNGTSGFSFGQSQTAPNSGFASPALQSPAIQSQTAPGSPNPFDFGANTASSSGRKIAQPKTRRKR